MILYEYILLTSKYAPIRKIKFGIQILCTVNSWRILLPWLRKLPLKDMFSHRNPCSTHNEHIRKLPRDDSKLNIVILTFFRIKSQKRAGTTVFPVFTFRDFCISSRVSRGVKLRSRGKIHKVSANSSYLFY